MPTTDTYVYDSLGNHEFDERVAGIIPFIRNLSAPVLAANLILDKVPELQDEPNFYKSIILNKNGVKIGVIGYLTAETKFLAPKNAVEYEDEVIAIRREVIKLKDQGVNILIALGHSGYIKDLQIAEKVEELDLVIGGHSNTFLWNSNSTQEIPEYPDGPYPVVVKQPSGRSVLVVQAYAYTKYMGRIHLMFNSFGEIIHHDGEPLLLNQEIPRDPELLAIVDKYRANVDIIFNEVVGTSTVMLNGDCRLKECNMGNVITDAVLYCTAKNHTDVNIALVQGGRVRSSISKLGEPPFKLTRGDWLTVIPFTDTLCIVTMNGTDLLLALEHSVDTWRPVDSTGQFLQFSGMQVVYDLGKPPGARVVKAKAICSGCGQHTLGDIQENYKYKAIMPTFLAYGGDGYKVFDGLPEKDIVTFDEISCIVEYLESFSPINTTTSDRITILNKDKITTPIVDPKGELRPGRLLPSSAHRLNYSFKLFCVVLSLYNVFSCC